MEIIEIHWTAPGYYGGMYRDIKVLKPATSKAVGYLLESPDPDYIYLAQAISSHGEYTNIECVPIRCIYKKTRLFLLPELGDCKLNESEDQSSEESRE